MSDDVKKIGILIAIFGLVFGVGYIASFIPGAINSLIEFAKTYWWIMIIIGFLIYFIGMGMGKK